MHELFPVVGGFLLGVLVSRLRPTLARPMGAAGAIAIGLAATIISGEFRLSWDFLAIDIPGTALAVATGYLAAPFLRRVRRQRPRAR
jgi:uncharacterized membrane protein YedE/YeeE